MSGLRPSPRLRLLLLSLPALLAAGALPGCLTLSQSARSHTLPAGQLQLGGGVGLARPPGLDFEYARPANRDPDEEFFPPLPPAVVLEGSAFYGLVEGCDLGLRLRLPGSPLGWHAGAKAEALFQLLEQRANGSPLSLALGVGLDGFYRPPRDDAEIVTSVTTAAPAGEWDYGAASAVADGTFQTSYWGGQLDVPLVAAHRLNRMLELFGGVRWGYLVVRGTQRYLPDDDRFATLEYDKAVDEHTFGAMTGLTFNVTPGRRVEFVIVPQLYLFTLQIPDRGWQAQVGGTIETGWRF